MNNKYFQNTEEALRECEELTRDDHNNSEDRATLMAFYNGRQTMTDCDAEEKGVSELINHLFGYDSIQSAADQIFGIYSKSPIIWHIDVKNAPDGLNQSWGQKATKIINNAIKHSGRLKPEFKSFSGEVTLAGSYHFCFYDNYDWCPRGRRPLAPRGTSIIPADGDYFAIREELTLKDLYAYRNRTERLAKRGLETGWKLPAINLAIKAIEDNLDRINDRDHAVSSNVDSEGADGPTAEEREQDFQMDTTEAERLRLKIAVYFLYTSRPEEEGTPIDLSILARFPLEVKKAATENKIKLETLLFDKERYFKKAPDFLHSFFIDCNIGGKTTWHRSMGLGRLNYDSDVDVEKLFNEFMQGTKENLRRQFQVGTSADVETINRWLSGEEYSNVIPEGLTIVEGSKNPNAQNALSAMEILTQLSRMNASASVSNRRGQRSTDELEVQALERQGRNAEAIANKMNDIYDGLTHLGETIVERFLDDSILPSDRGYDEIKYAQDKFKEEGIPLAFLAARKNGRFTNLVVKVNRVAGDGDKVREIMTNRMLEQRLPLYSPQAQQVILRRITATETQDYDLAEELVPKEQKIDGGQVNVANNENQSSIHRGITQYVPQLNDDDIHLIHIPEHMGGLQGLLAKGQVSGWDELDMFGFQSIVQHLGLHMQQIENNQANRALATQITQALQGFIRQAQEFANNLQAKRQAEQQQMDPAQAAKLQLDGAKFQQDRLEHGDLVQHRADSLDLSRQKAGVNASLQLNQQNIQSEQMAVKDIQSQEALEAQVFQNEFQNQLAIEQQQAEDAREETARGQRLAQGVRPGS